MHLLSLQLEEFRSYRHLDLVFDPTGLRLHGRNASGKSSLLEAITMLATTRSPRSTADREVINWTSGADLGYPPFARLRGEVDLADGRRTVELTLQIDPARPAVPRKTFRLDGRPVRAMELVGVLKAVLFAPEDVGLVSGAPAGRRRYLDLTISQLDGRYLRSLARYNRLLSQRNSLLKAFARDRVDPKSPNAAAQLAYWDEELAAQGAPIIALRHRTLLRLRELVAERARELLPGSDLHLLYLPSFELPALEGRPVDLDIETAQQIVEREFSERLAISRPDEIRRGATLTGPHRDDFGLTLDGMELSIYGSRGQQRLAVIALKLAEAALMTEVGGEAPVLLLDDVLSELDAERRDLLIGRVAAAETQVFVTATDATLLDDPSLAALPHARVEQGTIG